MKDKIVLIFALALLTFAADPATGQETPEQAAAEAEAAAASVLAEAETARAEAENARREAERVAERAREASRARDELRRAQAERNTERAEEAKRKHAVRQEEIERAREELSRAHRELREAQREVARAHRELAREEPRRFTTRTFNLGDKPVIGVVLGEDGEDGVKLTGVSPDGPAEVAGIEAGDVLVAINGAALAGEGGAGRALVFETMETVKAGDTVVLDVMRDGEEKTFAVVAEVREPASWQSLVRIPEVATVQRIEGVPGEQRIVIESTVVPEIDEEALAERMEILRERLGEAELELRSGALHLPDEDLHGEKFYEFHYQNDFSDFAEHAFGTANVWFGLPSAHGLRLAPVNEALGAYFKTDRGVLVLDAKDGNAYQLEPGDVILQVGDSEVNSPSDLVRALRGIEPGDEIDFEIKRDRRDRTLKVTMPENRLGLR